MRASAINFSSFHFACARARARKRNRAEFERNSPARNAQWPLRRGRAYSGGIISHPQTRSRGRDEEARGDRTDIRLLRNPDSATILVVESGESDEQITQEYIVVLVLIFDNDRMIALPLVLVTWSPRIKKRHACVTSCQILLHLALPERILLLLALLNEDGSPCS